MILNPKIAEIIEVIITERASDLHLISDNYPVVRVDGKLTSLTKLGKLSAKDLEKIAFDMLGPERKEILLKNRDIDFSYNFENIVRCRVNIFFQKEKLACALRIISAEIQTIDDLNLPPIIHEFSNLPQGFVLITGPSGQGKSTTLAAIIDKINHTKAKNIITIEDPIEYLFIPDKSIISQREIRQDALTFAGALKATFRQDPDVIMVGEMRDPETISTAITAAETGHLVFATLHTNSAAQSIHRMVDSFPAEQQNQIRSQLSSSLAGIVSQRLVTSNKGGLIPACEIMINNSAVANLIRENKIHEIPVVIETSAEKGMISLNRYLANLIRLKEISLETAQAHSLRPDDLKKLVNR